MDFISKKSGSITREHFRFIFPLLNMLSNKT